MNSLLLLDPMQAREKKQTRALLFYKNKSWQSLSPRQSKNRIRMIMQWQGRTRGSEAEFRDGGGSGQLAPVHLETEVEYSRPAGVASRQQEKTRGQG